MTEHEWLTSTDPAAMLSFRQGNNPLSPRKPRLWACACARQTWRLLTDERSRNAVLVAERLADGKATAQELSQAMTDADRAQMDQWVTYGSPTSPREIPPTPGWSARCWAKCASRPDVFLYHSVNQHMLAASVRSDLQALLLRDICGNPWRAVKLCTLACADPEEGYHAPGCPLASPTVLAIARAAYEERREDGTLDADRLAILADALEDAGADNEDILSHLRGPEPHVRGCFAIDCILGKR